MWWVGLGQTGWKTMKPTQPTNPLKSTWGIELGRVGLGWFAQVGELDAHSQFQPRQWIYILQVLHNFPFNYISKRCEF